MSEWLEPGLKVLSGWLQAWLSDGRPGQRKWAAPSQERSLHGKIEAGLKGELRQEPESTSRDPCNTAGHSSHPEIKLHLSMKEIVYGAKNPNMSPFEETT